ncbi:CPBP family intramembrane glutamic endopeptidase [Olivibacter sp. CPCC 100613]|uniref:CPBP family intramembrane glutamic endopeptidase n=1 Tax=Olivibacter sp. CPCC 100613 TaxID=3079931 RepID=UPI002FF74AD2
MIKIAYQIQSQLTSYLQSKSYIQLFFIFLIAEMTFSGVTAFIATMIDPDLTYNPIEKESIYVIFIISVIVAPIIETFIFQRGVIEIGYRFKLKGRWLVFLSAILFGTAHHYNLVYALIMFFIGLLFAYSYLIIRNRYDTAKATLFVVLLHAASNLVAFLNNDVFDLF